MKKFAFSLGILFLGLGAFSFQQQQQDVDPNAAITFETEVHDFGTLKFAAPAEYGFKFTNTGKSELVVSRVQPTCGCTTPEYTQTPVKPGATGVIKLKFDTKRVGAFDKTATVYTNAGQKILRIKGVVEPQAAGVPTKTTGGPVEETH